MMKQWADAFIRRVDGEGLPVLAFVACQGSASAACHYWAEDVARNIYSHTKSYMSTAVGMAIADGVLSLEDGVADFFPQALPERPDDRLLGITLRHLLTMSSGFGEEFLMSPGRGNGEGAPDYVRYLFSQPIRHTPGSKFCYSNGDSYLAGRMVEARVGMTLRDYLDKRLFRPLDIPYPTWEHCPMGHTFGASSLQLRITDMMKLGTLYLNSGKWNGKQLVEPSWIAQATAAQISTPVHEGNPWNYAYGFQFWPSPYPSAYRADGMYGQITMVLPQAEAVIAIQCAPSDRFAQIRAALHEELLTHL